MRRLPTIFSGNYVMQTQDPKNKNAPLQPGTLVSFHSSLSLNVMLQFCYAHCAQSECATCTTWQQGLITVKLILVSWRYR